MEYPRESMDIKLTTTVIMPPSVLLVVHRPVPLMVIIRGFERQVTFADPSSIADTTRYRSRPKRAAFYFSLRSPQGDDNIALS